MQYKHNTLVIPLQRNQLTNRKIMDELTDIYKRIEYLRNNGVKMKEIADRVDMAPSVLSALYSSVLPAYIDLLKTRTPDEALDEALALVNNVSKKRLLNNVGSVRNRTCRARRRMATLLSSCWGKRRRSLCRRCIIIAVCILVTVCRLLRIA